MQQQFKEAIILAMQQCIQEQKQQVMQCHLALKAQMQNFLVFIQQYHDTHSQTDSSSPDQNHASDVIYLQAAIYRYFANTYCTPMTPDTHWYHHI